MTYTNEIIPVTATAALTERPRYVAATNMTNQIVGLIIDVSASMAVKGPGGRTKIEIVQDCVNNVFGNIEGLTEAEKAAIIFCIVTFSDEPRILLPPTPLSEFHGGIELEAGGCTNMGPALFTGFDIHHVIFKEFEKYQIDARRSLFFMMTDGQPTDNMTEACKYCNEYLDREYPKPSVKLNVILVPPANDPSEMAKLGKNVAIFHVDELEKGIAASFKLMKDSIVKLSRSRPGQSVKIDFCDLSFLAGRGGLTSTPEGNGELSETVWTWTKA